MAANPFTVVMTDTVALNDSLKLAFESQFIIANSNVNVMDAFMSYRQSIGAVSIKMARYDLLNLAITPLDEQDDPASEVMADSPILFTPKEHGNVVTTTNLVGLQSGGQSAMAAMSVIGINMGETTNKLATLAAETTGNVLFADGTADDTSLVAGDIMTGDLMNNVYNKLARANVPKINGAYVALMHDDVINDLRASSVTGEWMDVNKYANPGQVLTNEIGMYRGFRVVLNNHATFADQGGAGVVDAYKSTFLGFNGLGMAQSQIPSIRVTGPFDKLARFVNIGWLGTFEYGIVEPAAVWQMVSASSVGANV